jgi:hypothetical protein
VARKRIRRDDLLKYIEPITPPYIGQLTHPDGPLHIITEQAKKPTGGYGNSHFQITNCGRVTKWPTRVRRLRGYDLCKRCGTEAEFEAAWKNQMEAAEKRQIERDNEQAMKDAERIADHNWTRLGEMIEADINNELNKIVNSGQILIPLRQNEIAILRRLVYRYIKDALPATENAVGYARSCNLLLKKLEEYCD